MDIRSIAMLGVMSRTSGSPPFDRGDPAPPDECVDATVHPDYEKPHRYLDAGREPLRAEYRENVVVDETARIAHLPGLEPLRLLPGGRTADPAGELYEGAPRCRRRMAGEEGARIWASQTWIMCWAFAMSILTKSRSWFIRRASFNSRKRLIRIAFGLMLGIGLLLRLGVRLTGVTRTSSSTREKPIFLAVIFGRRGPDTWSRPSCVISMREILRRSKSSNSLAHSP